ncbi:MAG: UDP-N-acetylmuramoyl-tripeptide--D-alanyl-D-alanine ligase [Candidatus Dasytiphilus stammeri]
MIPLSLIKIAKIIEGKLIGTNSNIQTVITDTRSRPSTTKALFIALKGKRFDAHDFLVIANHLQQLGVIAAVVSRILPININLSQILVQDTRIALGKLAAWVRQQVKTKVLALTGSCGKSTVKEMVTSILCQCGKTLSTRNNNNNDIGVSLTLLQLTEEYIFAIIEVGTNHPGEIAYSIQLIRPDVVLINNIGLSHLQGLRSLLGVALEKGQILSGLVKNGLAIINYNSHYIEFWKKLLCDKTVLFFSLTEQEQGKIHFFASNIMVTARNTLFTLNSYQGKIDILLPLLGEHNVANALAASALASSLNICLKKIKTGLESVKILPGRLHASFLDIDKNQLLIDDTYNANVSSMIAAAMTLEKMPGYLVMVIGDMAELGKYSLECHRQVGLVVRTTRIDKIISIGNFSKNISQIHRHGEHFYDQLSLIKHLKMLLSKYRNITILIKGSRNMLMENIVSSLQD